MKTYSIAHLLIAAAAIPGLYALSLWFKEQYQTDDILNCNLANYIVANILHGASICLFFHLITKSLGFNATWRIWLNTAGAVITYGCFLFFAFPGNTEILSSTLVSVALFAAFIKFLVSSAVVEFSAYELTTRFTREEP